MRRESKRGSRWRERRGSAISYSSPETKRSASTWPRSISSARSLRKALRRGSMFMWVSLAIAASCLRHVDDAIGEAFEIERTLDSALNQHVAAITLVAAAAEEIEFAHRVERAGDDRFGYGELLCQLAHGVRRGFQIDRQQDAHLPWRKIGLTVMNKVKVDIMPEPQRLAGIDVAHHREIRFGAVSLLRRTAAAGNPSLSSAVTIFEQGKKRPDALGFAAERAAGPRGRRPAENIHVQIGFGLIYETPEEQGGQNRSGITALRGIVDIGEFGFDETLIGSPERHSPERIIFGCSAFQHF